ncbi:MULTISPECIES: hypothetical protein [unclassified Streptomyces]|uniref:hypothetical protein n=1 Tax=unclassified Streptomyces TaxID=2593676 RepID=UPI002366BC4F|nr:MULTISPECIES: hypothetical protein [unclassified Streptomyces]MDF3145816.1 hypothetical protein [Streptomyces sp. T21Q-yed]WDF41776.1 hypothetical protein PBV52_35775 [Streptomyces sp. T12]
MLKVVTTDRHDAVTAPVGPRGLALERREIGERDVYYRVGPGRLEWSEDPADLAGGRDGQLPDRHLPAPGTLLALVHGLAPPPDATPLPGVRRLALGTAVHVGPDGVTVSRRRPTLPAESGSLLGAVADVLAAAPDDYAIAYGGGLSSAFLAVAALAVGHRPQLVHADLGLPGFRPAPAPLRGLDVRRVPIDVFDLLDHHRAPLGGLTPTLPDVEFPRRLAAALSSAAGRPLASAALLEDLAAAKLSDLDMGYRDWRLLTCEPFHLSGVLPSLREAADLLAQGVVRSDRPDAGVPEDAQPLDGPPPPPPLGRRDLPVMTPQGRVALQTTQQASLSVWKDHLDFLGPLLGRADAGVTERVPRDSLVLPALDPLVLGALEALPPERLGRVSRGLFRNNGPLVAAVARHRVRGLRRASSSFDLRLAAAAYLHRERAKIIDELERESALADMGVIDPGAVAGLMRSGPGRADHALPLLRLLWIDRWLKG